MASVGNMRLVRSQRVHQILGEQRTVSLRLIIATVIAFEICVTLCPPVMRQLQSCRLRKHPLHLTKDASAVTIEKMATVMEAIPLESGI